MLFYATLFLFIFNLKKIEILFINKNNSIKLIKVVSKMSKNVIAKKPYCKVCHDAGKPEREYNSHWVKDITGKITCPNLLNNECRYCFKIGHTAKFCDVLVKNNKEKERIERRTQFIARNVDGLQSKQSVQKKKPVNGFAALCEDSDSEKEINTNLNIKINNNIVVNEYPSLCAPTKKKQIEVKSGWSAIAAKPKEVNPDGGLAKPISKTDFVVLSDYIKKPFKKPIIEAKIAPWVSKITITKNWADSENEEDDISDISDISDVSGIFKYNRLNEVLDDTW